MLNVGISTVVGISLLDRYFIYVCMDCVGRFAKFAALQERTSLRILCVMIFYVEPVVTHVYNLLNKFNP